MNTPTLPLPAITDAPSIAVFLAEQPHVNAELAPLLAAYQQHCTLISGLAEALAATHSQLAPLEATLLAAEPLSPRWRELRASRDDLVKDRNALGEQLQSQRAPYVTALFALLAALEAAAEREQRRLVQAHDAVFWTMKPLADELRPYVGKGWGYEQQYAHIIDVLREQLAPLETEATALKVARQHALDARESSLGVLQHAFGVQVVRRRSIELYREPLRARLNVLFDAYRTAIEQAEPPASPAVSERPRVRGARAADAA